jgi:hypothetical protein
MYGFEYEIAEDELVVGKSIDGDGVALGLDVASGLLVRPELAVEVSSICTDGRFLLLGDDDAIVRYDSGFDKNQVSRLALVWGVISDDGKLYEIDLRYGNDVIVREL